MSKTKSKYPFSEMEIGEIKTILGDPSSQFQKRVSANAFAYSYRKHDGMLVFSTRQIDCGIEVKRLQ